MRVISAVYYNNLIATHLSDHWKFLELDLLTLNFRAISASNFAVNRDHIIKSKETRVVTYTYYSGHLIPNSS